MRGNFESLNASDPPINRFDTEVWTLEHNKKPVIGGTVFLGSSTFTKWHNLENDFSELAASNLAFGGSTIPEQNHYFDGLLAGYEPKQLVLYCGTNDIGEEHHSGQQVFQDFVKFDQHFHEKFPNADLFFVSMSMAPCRASLQADYDIGNKLIHNYMDTQTNDHYIDVTPVMYDSNHKLNDKLFLPDHLHMTQAGYDLWEPIIKKAIEPKT